MIKLPKENVDEDELKKIKKIIKVKILMILKIL